MKRLILFLLLLPASVCVAADAPTAMPNEVTLTTGRVLRNVKVIRWEKDRVVLQYAGGADPIPFALFKIPAPETLAAIRAAEGPAKTAAGPTLAKERTLTGGVSTSIRGVFHFSGVAVKAYPASEWDAASARQKAKLPDNLASLLPNEHYTAVMRAWTDALKDLSPVTETTTDASGNYSLALPANTEVFLVCTATRRTPRAFEQFAWVMRPPAGATKVDLNDSNHFGSTD